MGKRVISSLLILLIMLLSLSGCAEKAEVKIGGTDINNEITAYFKDAAKENEDVNALIARYVAINSEFANHSLSVPGNRRASLSEDVNNIWHIWGGYYENLGISKETIYKIELSKVYESLLMEEYYGKDGKNPVNEKEIKEFFRENYAPIRFVTGYLFEVTEDGSSEMTKEQKEKLIGNFKAAREAMNSGTGFEEAIAVLGSAEIHNTVVNSRGNDNFPDGFWDKVKKIETGKTDVITLGSYVFLVQRVDGEKGEYACYEDYRSDCLYKMKGAEFEKVIDGWAKQYK